MKKYNVTVNLGSISYEVEAENEEQAEENVFDEHNVFEDTEREPFDVDVEEIR